MDNRKPLVSVCIPNYNYGEYLGECLESVLNQTYSNIEVLVRDNCSTDNSYRIAERYKTIFEKRGIYFNLSYNKRNLGSDKNSQLLSFDAEGEFVYHLASDDAIEPDFIEKCVRIFEKYPKVATVIVHRKEMDEQGNLFDIIPFYNQDCVIDGESQAAVYMMAGIAIPGQRMIRASVLGPIRQYQRVFNVAGDWYANFLAAMVGDVAYVREPLCRYRVHTGNETNESEKNLLGIFEHYQLIHAFRDISLNFGMNKPAMRYDEAVAKLGDMCLRYALKMLKCGEQRAAERYLQLSPVFKAEIITDTRYSELRAMVPLQEEELNARICDFEEKYNLNRTISYDPPEGYQALIL